MPIGHNVGLHVSHLGPAYETYHALPSLQRELEALEKHSAELKDITNLLQLAQKEYHREEKDKKGNPIPKTLDLQGSPELMDLVDRVREASTPDKGESYIDRQRYRWTEKDLEGLISNLQEDSKQKGNLITPTLMKFTHHTELWNRVMQILNDAQKVVTDEISYIIRKSAGN